MPDSRGCPKAPYYYLKRVLSPLALLVTDEGLNGVSLHAVNDRGNAIAATLSVILHRGEGVVARRPAIAFAEQADEERATCTDFVEAEFDGLLARALLLGDAPAQIYLDQFYLALAAKAAQFQ